jgi:hypothetical protein
MGFWVAMTRKGSASGKGGVADGDLALLHGLQKCRLNLGGGPVDFVGQDDVVEQRPFFNTEVAGLGAVDLRSHQVGRQQVGGELDAFEVGVNRICQGLDRTGFGQARHAFDKNVPPGEQPHEQAVDKIPLAHQPCRSLPGCG